MTKYSWTISNSFFIIHPKHLLRLCLYCTKRFLYTPDLYKCKAVIVTMDPLGCVIIKIKSVIQLLDWTNTWRLARLPGLGAEHCSFLFRLLHNLLPTRERLNRINSSSTITCRLCQDNIPEDQTHALFSCSFNNEAGQRLLDVLDTSPEKLLRLEVTVEDDLEFPATWLTSAVLLSIWSYGHIAK